MDGFEEVGAWIKGLELLTFLQMKRLQVDKVMVNSCSSANEKASQWQHSLQLIQSSVLVQLTPNVLAYSAAVSAAGRKGSVWTQALHIGQRAQQNLRRLDTVIHNAMITAVEKASFQWCKAFQIAQRLCLAGGRPSVVTCNALVSACENARVWEQAFNTLEVLHFLGLKPQVVTFNAMISSCGQLWPSTLILLEEMTFRQLLADSVSLVALAVACKSAWQQGMYLKTIFAVESTMSMKMALETRERGQTDMQDGARLMSELSDLDKFTPLQ
eukprot:symbB.v1.2.001141.t1/scaffold62.1/size503095/7